MRYTVRREHVRVEHSFCRHRHVGRRVGRVEWGRPMKRVGDPIKYLAAAAAAAADTLRQVGKYRVGYSMGIIVTALC